MFLRETTPAHTSLIDKRDALEVKITESSNQNIKSILVSVRDLYSYLIEADGNFSENLKIHFEQIENKLTIYPSLEDMAEGNRDTLKILIDLLKDLKDDANANISSVCRTIQLIEERLQEIEARLQEIEKQHTLVVSGQIEIIAANEEKLKPIYLKLDTLFDLSTQITAGLSVQNTTLQQVVIKIDDVDESIHRAEEDIKSIKRNIKFPLFPFVFGVVVCFVLIRIAK